ncbi:MFS transporter [Frankia sp. CNm7]|uniref:MFS transporter n=2 Tax=Frankia nepalensis TaxID=1836974 RepID=A0A937RKF0_9ACTN|nr:MFS transporter [Frankia nepalensis]MBL7512108.1 MFS transporter [Frankia nepalensis]MBL7519387.1 MFS transporter [Frankia nepalensis]MBL7631792.1 MFS transporter [Frankia nepalensis]
MTLIVIVACQLMLVLDATIVNVALPDIQRALDFSPTDLAWVLNAYTISFGGFLLLGGRAGDILGRRRVFQIGVLLFCLASLAGGLATESWMLVASRVGQGLGAAAASPNALALLTAAFAEGPGRTKALAAWAAANGVGGSIGLILGGMLTTWVSWRWVMFINVPIAVGIAILAPRFISGPPRNPGRFDATGAVTATVGLSTLVYGFIRASADGWGDTLALASFVISAAVLASFVVTERRASQPVVPLGLVADLSRARAYALLLLIVGSMISMFFFTTQFLQEVRDFSALRAGFAFLPLSVGILVSAQRTSRLLPRLGPKPLMLLGAALCTGGMVWLSQLSATTGYARGVLGPMLLFGLGLGMLMVPLSLAAVAGVGARESGAASSMMVATQQIGASLGLAVLVTVYGAASRDAAEHPPAGLGRAELADHALTRGMASAFTVAAAFVGLVFLVILVTWRNERQWTVTSETT